MGKKLVSERDVDGFICKSTNKFYMDGSLILTPGAKDALRDKGVKIEYGLKPESDETPELSEENLKPEQEICESSKDISIKDESEDLLIAVASVLKNEYGVTDPKELVESSLRIANIFKENLRR